MTSETLKAFGVELRAARVAAGWTLAQLAEAAFGNPDRKGYVSQIERGNRKINPLTVGKLAEALDLSDDVTRPMLANDDPPVDDAPTPEDEKAAKMIAAAETEGAPDVGESLLVALAYEYAEGDATDLQSAYKGLRAALDAARAELGDNTDASVTVIRARVDALNHEGEPEAAAEVIDEAIEQKSAQTAAVLKLGVQQDRLRNDPQAAAEKLVMGLRLGVAENRLFGALLTLCQEWFFRGQDHGLNFDASVAFHLADALLRCSRNSDQRGAAGNTLGIALRILGERDIGNDRLEAAIQVTRRALNERTRERVPYDWAKTQVSLGNAQLALGEKARCIAKVEEAIIAYRSALEIRTRKTMPKEWAMTQMNLGNAELVLGELSDDIERLKAAVSAYKSALEVRTRERMPFEWAMTQMNLGNAFGALGQRESGTEQLEEARVAYQNALKEWTRVSAPFDWASAQYHLGNLLLQLGERQKGTERLGEAAAHYHAAIEEWTYDKVPLDWAKVHMGLAKVALAFFEKTRNTAHLGTAQSHANEAREVFVSAFADHSVDMIDRIDDHIRAAQKNGGKPT